MTSSLVPQRSFRGGEVDAELSSRDPRYAISLRTCKNFLPIVHGALINRAGTRFLGFSRTSVVRFVPFVFSDAQAVVLEFTGNALRFWTTAGQVLNAGAPYEVVTPYAAADLARLKFAQAGDIVTITHPSYQPQELTRASNTNWTLGPVSLSPIAFFGTGNPPILLNFYLMPPNGILPPLFDPAHAYATNDLVSIVDSAGNTSQYISLQNANTGHAPETSADWWQRHSWSSVIGPQPTFKKGEYVFYAGLLYLSLADGNLNQNPTTAGSTYWARADDATRPAVSASYVVTEVWRDANGIVRETLPSNPLVSPYGGKLPRYTDRPFTISWGLPALGAGPAAYQFVGHNIYMGASGLYGLIGATDGTKTTFEDKGAAPDFGTQPPKGTNPFLVADGKGTANTTKWPGGVVFHEQRRVFFRSDAKPDRFFGSEVGDIGRFDVNNPPQDSDAYEWRLSSQMLEEIRSAKSFSRLCLFTGQGEWSAQGKDGGGVTPNSVEVRRHGAHGSSYLDPVEVEHALLFNTSKGNYVRDFFFDYNSNAFVGTQICEFARHLFRGFTIVAWAHQRVPYHTVWIIRSDGMLLSLTYDRATQTVAWAQHPMDGQVLAVACIPNGTEDALLLCVLRNGAPCVEVMASRDFIPDQRFACFLDASLTFDGRNTGGVTMMVTGASFNQDDIVTVEASAASFAATDIGDQVVMDPDGAPTRITVTAFTDASHVSGRLEAPLSPAFQNFATPNWGWARDTLTGYAHLEGRVVTVLAEGVVQGPFVVDAGTIGPLNPPALIAVAGLSYNSDAELLDIAGDAAKPNVKAVIQVIFDVVASRGIFAGEDFDHLREAKLRKVSDNFGTAAPFTGQVAVKTDSSWNAGGRACVRQSAPLPLTIVGVSREVEVGGRP